MRKRSAGLMLYRRSEEAFEVFLVHPGGPYWSNKDRGTWTVPKGEYESGETALSAAKREFHEETGFPVPDGEYIELGTVRQKSGKEVVAWAVEGDGDSADLVSNTCLVEWPPRSGKQLEIPEIDQGRWFLLREAVDYIREEQKAFLARLEALLTT